MNIRKATENDIPQILGIYNDIILNTTAVYDYEAHTIEMRMDWFRQKNKSGFPVFVADDEGQILGFSSFGPFRSWAAYLYTVENSVYVKSDARGKGVGKQLMPPIIESAKEMKMHAMVAGIDSTNAESIRLHEAFGFREVAHFKEVGWKFDRWLDLKFLQLILK